MLKKYIILISFLIFQQINAQDPVFTQFYSAPTIINPAFSGSEGNTRIGLGYRNQWMGRSYDLSTFYVAADTYMESINSGIGLSVLNQSEELTNYNYTLINATYSFHLKLTETWTFFPGIGFGYGFKQFNFQNLILGDQINIYEGNISPVSNDPSLEQGQVSFFDISAGGVFYSENTWLGVSFKHLTKPDISFTGNEKLPLEMFFSLHGGYRWVLEQSTLLPENSFLFLTANYMNQGVYNRLDFGVEMEVSKFSFGVLASTVVQKIVNDAENLLSISPIIGLQFEKFKLGISYDYPVSDYSNLSGTGEITFQYYIRNNHERKRMWQSKY